VQSAILIKEKEKVGTKFVSTHALHDPRQVKIRSFPGVEMHREAG
jgi:hypothetical protein